VAFIRAADIDHGRVIFETASKINVEATARITKGIGAPGDVLLTHKGTVGRVALVPLDAPPFVCSPQTTLWRSLDENELDRGYLYAFLDSPIFGGQLHASAGETDMAPYASLTSQRAMTVTIPPINVQRAIANVLTALDARIQLLGNASVSLEAIARAIFKSWFVDFDPVRAKAEGREPEGMDASTAALFPDEFQQGNQPAIPLGWSLSPLSAVSDVIYGAAFSSDRFNTKGIGHPLIRIRDLKTMDPGVFTDEMHSKGHLISAGDVVVGMDGEFRAYHWLGARSWLNQRVCFFKPSGGAGRVFIREALRPLLEAVERGQVGTTVIHIGKADIGRFQIPLATASVLKAFNEIAESLLDRIICTSETMRSLGELRDTLLPRLISGKLRIPEAEKLVEAVL
jgi:type I restriction enzyme S subunit